MTDKSKAQRKTGAKLSYDSPVILTFALLALIVYIIQSIFPATTYKYFCIYDASVSDPLFTCASSVTRLVMQILHISFQT